MFPLDFEGPRWRHERGSRELWQSGEETGRQDVREGGDAYQSRRRELRLHHRRLVSTRSAGAGKQRSQQLDLPFMIAVEKSKCWFESCRLGSRLRDRERIEMWIKRTSSATSVRKVVNRVGKNEAGQRASAQLQPVDFSVDGIRYVMINSESLKASMDEK